jgi:hypothetical protein
MSGRMGQRHPQLPTGEHANRGACAVSHYAEITLEASKCQTCDKPGYLIRRTTSYMIQPLAAMLYR